MSNILVMKQTEKVTAKYQQIISLTALMGKHCDL